VVVDGDWCQVACAVRADGVASPAGEMLDALEKGEWDDPEAEALPDSWQVRWFHRLLAACEALANGDSLSQSAYNRLRDGIWELKAVMRGSASMTPMGVGDGYRRRE